MNEERLTGWKAIAEALGVSIRTAQYWHAKEDMPIQFHRHSQRGTPTASRLELTLWRANRGQSKLAAARLTAAAAAAQSPPAAAPASSSSRRILWQCAGIVMVGIAICVFLTRQNGGLVEASGTPVTLQAPDHVFGVEKVEARVNAFSMCDLVTRECLEWRFCPRTPGFVVPFYAGFVITRLRVKMLATCAFLDDTATGIYTIARGKQRNDAARDPYNSIYRDVTKDEKRFPNWLDRPVLATNCNSTPDDLDTVCSGGEADFGLARGLSKAGTTPSQPSGN